MALRFRLWPLRLRRAPTPADVERELHDHLERQTADYMADGLSEPEARRKAQLLFGGVPQVAEATRESWRWQGSSFLSDLRGAGRAARHAPLWTALVVATIALTAGIPTVIFTLANAIWLRPRPVADPARLVGISNTAVRGAGLIDLLDLRDVERLRQLPVFESVTSQLSASVGQYRPYLTLDDVGRPVETLSVDGNYFETLGVPVRGRPLLPGDDRLGASPAIVISDRLWRTAFGGRADLPGASVPTSHGQMTVVGIAPRGFRGARLGEQFDVWIPHRLMVRVSSFSTMTREMTASEIEGNLSRFLPVYVLVRTGQGVSVEQVQQAIIAPDIPGGNAPADRRRLVAHPFATAFAGDRGTVLVGEAPLLRLVGWISGLLLGAGCVTLAALTLARYEQRRQEFATRLALGAPASRLVRLLSTELAVVAALGGTLALGVAVLGSRWTQVLTLPSGLELDRLDFTVDWRTTAFAFAAAVVTVGLAALVPILRFTRPWIAAELGTRHASPSATSVRWRLALLTVHVAVAVVLAVTAALFVRTLAHGFNRTPGFDVYRTVFMDLRPGVSAFIDPNEGGDQPGQADRERSAYDRLVTRLGELPGVHTVAVGSSPLRWADANQPSPVTVAGTSATRQVEAVTMSAGPGYADALGLRRLAGRGLPPSLPGPTTAHPVLVTASLAQALRPDGTVVGSRVGRPGAGALPQALTSPVASEWEVVGVVEDFLIGSVRSPTYQGILTATEFRGFLSAGSSGVSLTIGTNPEAAVLLPQIRAIASDVFPQAALLDVRSGAELVARDLGRERLAAWFFSAFGLVSAGLALAGVFGLVAYVSETRRREVIVRLALGAPHGRLMRQAVATSVLPVLVGAAVGLAGAALVSRALDAFIHGIDVHDPVSFAAPVLLVVTGAIAAGLLAAVRIRSFTVGEGLRSE